MTKNICIIGADSVYGFGDSENGGWVNILKKMLEELKGK